VPAVDLRFRSNTASDLRLVVPTGSDRARLFLGGARVFCGVGVSSRGRIEIGEIG